MNNVAVHHEKTQISLGFSYPLSTQRMNRIITWAPTREKLTSVFANNTGADQPAHSHSLISNSVIRLLESTIS